MSCPIFVEDEVVRKANGLKFDEKVESTEKLRKWLESLRPDDFGKYKM
jgi:bifunctional DNase/RNase